MPGPIPIFALALLHATAAHAGSDLLVSPEPVAMHALGANAYFALAGAAQFTPLDSFSSGAPRKAFELPDYVVLDPVVVPVPGPASEKAYAYFTMIERATADECRKTGWDLFACPAALEKRAVGFASFNGNGWTVKGPILAAKASGDGTSPYAASAIVKGQEVWLYYLTAMRDPKVAGIFRQKFSADGFSSSGDPERLVFEDAAEAPSFDRLDVTQLTCPGGASSTVISMVASVRAQDAIPFLISGDGLNFRQESNSVVPHLGSPLSSPAQLAMSTVGAECASSGVRHQISREILYSERKVTGSWTVKRVRVSVSVRGNELPGALPAAREAAPAAPSGKCTAADYLKARPDAAMNLTYVQNPMLHYLVYGKDEGACEPSLPPAPVKK